MVRMQVWTAIGAAFVTAVIAAGCGGADESRAPSSHATPAPATSERAVHALELSEAMAGQYPSGGTHQAVEV